VQAHEHHRDGVLRDAQGRSQLVLGWRQPVMPVVVRRDREGRRLLLRHRPYHFSPLTARHTLRHKRHVEQSRRALLSYLPATIVPCSGRDVRMAGEMLDGRDIGATIEQIADESTP